MSALRTAALGAAGQLSLGSLFVRLTLDAAHFTRGWTQAQATMTSASLSMTRAAVGMTAAIGGSMTILGVLGAKEAAKFEQSFAGVRRTVEATESQFKELAGQFRQMAKEIPVNVNEINRIAESAGALGIPIKDMKEFTRVMAMMGSVTNMTSDQAAVSMARIANIMDIAGGGYARMGATVLALGQSTVATESEIVEMGKRIAGAGNIVGLTTAQVLGLAASFASVGVRAEAGGTAMSQIMIRMSKAVEEGGSKLQIFAEAAGMTGAAFQKLFREDAGAAIVEFLKGIKQIDQAGGDVFKMLEGLQIDGARVTAILLQAAGAGDKLTQWMNTGTRAWEENTALVRAAEERYKTFISQLKITAGMIRDILITIGDQMLPVLKAFNAMLQGTLKDTENMNSGFMQFVSSIAPAFIFVITKIGDIIHGWRLIIKTGEAAFLVMASLVLNAFAKVVETIRSAVEGLVNAIIGGVNKVIKALNVLLPKAREVAEIKLITLDKTEGAKMIEDAAKAVEEALAESRAELAAMVAGGSFSDQFKKEYEKVTAVVVKENEKVVENTEKTVERVIEKMTPMSDRMRKAYAELEALAMQKPEDRPALGSGLDKQDKQDSALREFEDPMIEMMDRLSVEKELAQEQLNLLDEMHAAELGMTEAMQQKKLELVTEYGEKINQINMAQASMILGISSGMFDDLANITEVYAGRQSGAFQALFAVSKAFAVAEALIKIQQGIANAASLTFPANLAAIGSVIAATSSIVSTIQGVKLEFAGGRASGGPVTPGNYYRVGEQGEELFAPNVPGNIIPNHALGGGGGANVKVIVNNYTDATATVTQNEEGGEQVIEVLLKRVKNDLSSEVRDGRGDFNRSLQSTFNLKRGK